MSNDNYTNLICSRQKLIKEIWKIYQILKNQQKILSQKKKIDVELMCSNEDG
jgi:hypothetical protein